MWLDFQVPHSEMKIGTDMRPVIYIGDVPKLMVSLRKVYQFRLGLLNITVT